MYDMGSGDGHSYIWNEAISRRGGSEIASCVYSYIDKMSKRGKRKFVFLQ